jgi:hypothetical protein
VAPDFCGACAALERDQGKQAEKDEADRKSKKQVYERSRLWQVMTRDEAKQAAEEYAARRKSGNQARQVAHDDQQKPQEDA